MDGLGKLLLMIIVLVLVISGRVDIIFLGFLGFLGLCVLSNVIDWLSGKKINKDVVK
ncbi:UNVERIFIED_ORG: ABC-type enterochelin transport system permease subunit [Rahnella aquatilis]